MTRSHQWSGVHHGAKHIYSCVSSFEQDVRSDHEERIYYVIVINDGNIFIKLGDKLISGQDEVGLVEYSTGMTSIGITIA